MTLQASLLQHHQGNARTLVSIYLQFVNITEFDITMITLHAAVTYVVLDFTISDANKVFFKLNHLNIVILQK